jgi:hypothetical protein
MNNFICTLKEKWRPEQDKGWLFYNPMMETRATAFYNGSMGGSD